MIVAPVKLDDVKLALVGIALRKTTVSSYADRRTPNNLVSGSPVTLPARCLSSWGRTNPAAVSACSWVSHRT